MPGIEFDPTRPLTSAGLRNAHSQGQFAHGLMRRQGPPLTAGRWGDMSYSAGVPVANYYASTPLVSAVLPAHEGIYHGPASSSAKYLHSLTILPPSSAGIGHFALLDYVMFYPFLGGDDGLQPLVTQHAARYGGSGLRIMAVSQGLGTGVSNCIITYTNQGGVSGRVTTATLDMAVNAGVLCSSTPAGRADAFPCGPFVPLAPGDLGVQSIQSCEVITPAGGAFALVLVRPLDFLGQAENSLWPIEKIYTDDTTTLVAFDGAAYLHLLQLPSTSNTAAPSVAHLETIWT